MKLLLATGFEVATLCLKFLLKSDSSAAQPDAPYIGAKNKVGLLRSE